MNRWIAGIVFCAGGVLASASCFSQDRIEFLTGAKAEGKVASIDKDKQQVAFSAVVGGRTFDRVYSYAQIHAITYRGKRYVLNPLGATPTGGGTSSTGDNDAATPKPGNAKAMIAAAGRTPPDWYDNTPLDYPKSLDLSWPKKPPGGWNNQKNVGQYLWDVINPNPARWKSGVKLIHHLLSEHQDDPEKRQRAMNTLGGMYFNLFQDYARAAYWWEKAGAQKNSNNATSLAECYIHLGDRRSAIALLVDPDRPGRQATLSTGMIQIWGILGETNKAVKLAQAYVNAGGNKHLAYLYAGDACRSVGRYPQAIQFYEEVINTPNGNYRRADQTKTRARTNIEGIRLFELLDLSKVPDGTYQGDSRGYEDPVHVEVSVEAGRITSVNVTKHREKQFYSSIKDVPAQIIAKQGVKGVQATSRATITGDAIINATAKALKQ